MATEDFFSLHLHKTASCGTLPSDSSFASLGKSGSTAEKKRTRNKTL